MKLELEDKTEKEINNIITEVEYNNNFSEFNYFEMIETAYKLNNFSVYYFAEEKLNKNSENEDNEKHFNYFYNLLIEKHKHLIILVEEFKNKKVLLDIEEQISILNLNLKQVSKVLKNLKLDKEKNVKKSRKELYKIYLILLKVEFLLTLFH